VLSREFIKTGILPKDSGEIFRTIQTGRTDSDYGDYVEISKKGKGFPLKGTGIC